MKDQNSKALDLFLLMFNLSQLILKEKIVDVFVEAIKEIWSDIIVSYQLSKTGDEKNIIEISTSNSNYGFIKIDNFADLENEDQGLLQNAVGMLAIILKENEQDKLLADEKLHLQKLVDEKINALKESEVKYRNIFENIQDVYFETLIDGTILELSPSIGFITKGQYNRNELIGKSMYDFYLNTNERQTLLSALRERGSVTDFEITLKNKDGSQISCSISSKICFDTQGNPEKIIGGMRDISTRKQSEKVTTALYDISKAVYTSDTLDLLFSRIHHALVQIIHAKNLFIALIDEAGENLVFPYEVDENTDDSSTVISLNDSQSLTVAVIKSRKPLLLDEKELNERYASGKSRLWKSKPKCWMGVPLLLGERVIGAMAVQDYDKAGVYTNEDVLLFTVAAEQVTIAIQRKISEEALKESEEHFRSVAQSANDGIITADNKGIILGWNPGAEKIFGYTEKEISGKELSKIIPQDYIEQHIKGMRRIEQGGENHVIGKTVELHGIHKNGKEFPLELSLAEWETSNGKFFTGIIRDITQRKQAENEIQKHNIQLSEINAAKDKFFSIIAHDLKSPFLGFLNLTEIMATESQDFTISQFAEFSQALNESAVNLYKLLENLLDWATIQRGKMDFNLQKHNLSKLVSQSISTIMDRAKQKGISIINLVEDSIKVSADEKMINSVFRNLLSNAVKFTRKDGTITVNAKSIDNGMIEISVSDTGVGISKDVVVKLFKVGEKIGSKGTEGELSTGLGLLLCKEFIEMHNGKIWVESKEEIGSTFYFTLPKII
ncbi:MAG: PAS domain S-box protein [Ignavibacteriales bacterium]|nr:PAS domain S-box protein [Ignavibacteriales bacterium]